MKTYLRVLAVLYAIGGLLHILDLLDLRLHFSEMSLVWKIWIVYLIIFDLIAASGLWLRKKWGHYCFFLVAGSQLIAYSAFMNIFGRQYFLIVFHLVTLLIYFVYARRELNLQPKVSSHE